MQKILHKGSYCIKITDFCNKPVQATKKNPGGGLMKTVMAAKETGWQQLVD